MSPSPPPISVAATRTLSTTGSTRGTAYWMSNKIVTLGSKTHVAWLDMISEIKVCAYDRDAKQWGPVVHVGTGHDNHGGPALAADSEGYLHLVFGPHGGEFQHHRSARPNDGSEWTEQPRFGVRGTYPSLVIDAHDTLHVTYRGMSVPLKLVYQRRPKGGQWSAPRALVDPAVPDGYTQYGNSLYVQPDGTLHLSFHIYDLHPAAGKSVGYLRSDDGGDTWTLAGDRPAKLPYRPDMPGWVEQGKDLDMRCGNVCCDPEGRPYFVALHQKPQPHTSTLWTFDEGKWRGIPLAPVVHTQFPNTHVLAECVSFDDAGNLYLLAEISQHGGWGDKTNEIVLLYSEDRAKTFSLLPLSSDSGEVGNWLPSLERHTGHNPVALPALIYTHGEPGKTCSDPISTGIRFVELQRK